MPCLPSPWILSLPRTYIEKSDRKVGFTPEPLRSDLGTRLTLYGVQVHTVLYSGTSSCRPSPRSLKEKNPRPTLSGRLIRVLESWLLKRAKVRGDTDIAEYLTMYGQITLSGGPDTFYIFSTGCGILFVPNSIEQNLLGRKWHMLQSAFDRRCVYAVVSHRSLFEKRKMLCRQVSENYIFLTDPATLYESEDFSRAVSQQYFQ